MKKIIRILILGLILFLLAACTSSTAEGTTPPTFDIGIDPNAWAVVPAGEFLMGQHEHEVMVDYDYEMMVTHVTNQQYADYLNQALAADEISIQEDADLGQQVVGYYGGDEFRAYNHEVEITAGDWLHVPLEEVGVRIQYDGSSFSVKSGYGDHPVTFVTWFGAKAYCESFGWWLPTETEWEKGARGTDGRPFPWGDGIDSGNANYYGSRDLFEEVVGKLGDTTPVGYYNGMSHDDDDTQDSASPYGLYDMAGNVWHWTGDIYENTHLRYMRGGSKANYQHDLRVWTRNSAGPDYASPNVGFRCARNP